MYDKLALTGLIHEELEPRLLFSAGAEAVLIDDNKPDTEQAIVETVAETDTVILEVEQIQQHAEQSGPVHEVVFIDENVEDYDQLMADLANKSNIDIYILDSSLDGIEQISAVLEHYQDLDAVHLVSHGNEQGLLLGNSSLNNNNIESYSETISGWQTALGEHADLLIYGCDVASSEQGLALLDKLNILTASDIAASDDKTGQAANGGDWDLEYHRGDIESVVVFSSQLQANWQGTLLAVPAIVDVNGDVNAYNEDDGATVIDQGTLASVSDGGVLTDFSSGKLVVGIVPPVDTTEDTLSIRNQGTGAGQIGFDGTTVTYGGVTIGTANVGGGSNGINLTITFSGNPSETAVGALVQNITYENTDTINPTTGARTVQFTLTNNLLLSDTQSATVNVSAVNDAPTAANNTVTTNEDSAYTFTAADFNFSDVEGDTMSSVKVTGLESAGNLQLNGVDVTLNQVVSKADIDAGNLKFSPLTNANGAAYDSFGFSVNDGTDDSISSYTMSIDVTPQNDLPTAANNNIATTIDTAYVFSASDFNFSDVDGDSLASIKVTGLESAGRLQLNGVDVTLNQVISRADIDAGQLSFTPQVGTSGPAYDNFSFAVNDGSIDSATSYTMTIDVNTGTIPAPLAGTGGGTGTGTGLGLGPGTDGGIEPVVMNPLSDEAGPDSPFTPIDDGVKTDQHPQSLPDTDVVVDIDAGGEPALLFNHAAADLLQSLGDKTADSDAAPGTLIAGLTGDDRVPLASSTSPSQAGGELQQALEELNRQLGSNGWAEKSDGHVIIKTVAGISIGLTAGFLSWALQGSSLLTALLTTLPAWNTFDPLPVLNAQDKRKTKHRDSKTGHDNIDSVFEG